MARREIMEASAADVRVIVRSMVALNGKVRLWWFERLEIWIGGAWLGRKHSGFWLVAVRCLADRSEESNCK